MKKRRHIAHLVSRTRFIFSLCALVLAGFALTSLTLSAHSSPEVAFIDPSASGLSIVPASCPSTPDYSGQCDENYNVASTCDGTTGTINMSWDFSPAGPGYTEILLEDPHGNVLINDVIASAFGISGSDAVPGLGAGQYTWQFEPSNGDAIVSGTATVDDCGNSQTPIITTPHTPNTPGLTAVMTELAPGEGSVVHPGDLIQYRVTLNSTGTEDLTNVGVTDYLPSQLTLSWQGGGSQNAGITNGVPWWGWNTFPKNAVNYYVDAHYAVNDGVADGTQICNNARITSDQLNTFSTNSVCNPVGDDVNKKGGLPSEPPVTASCSSDNTAVTISWLTSDGAAWYQPSISSPDGGCPSGWTALGSGNDASCYLPHYGNTTVTIPIHQNTPYATWVAAMDDTGNSDWSNEHVAGFQCGGDKIPPAPPASITPTCSADQSHVTLSWDAVSDATQYNVGISVPDSACPSGWTPALNADGSWGHTCALSGLTATSIRDVPITTGSNYSAWVSSQNPAGWSATAADTGNFSCSCPDGDVYSGGKCVPACPDGSVAPGGDTTKCVVHCPAPYDQMNAPDGNIANCPCNPSDPSCNIKPDSGCNVQVMPSSAAPSSAVTVAWATGCSPAHGCSYLGLPVTPDNATLNGSPVDVAGVSVDHPAFSSNPVQQYKLNVTYYAGLGPLRFAIDSYQCTGSVVKKDDSTTCPDGSPAPGGNTDNCSSICSEPTTQKCSDDNSSYSTYDSNNNVCSPATICRYAAQGFGCVQSGNSAYCLEPTEPTLQFKVAPTLIHSGDTTQVSWNIDPSTAKDTDEPIRCTVSGSNSIPLADSSMSDTWTDTTSSVHAIVHQSSPITSQTVYTLECEGTVTGVNLPVQKATVNLIPKFKET